MCTNNASIHNYMPLTKSFNKKYKTFLKYFENISYQKIVLSHILLYRKNRPEQTEGVEKFWNCKIPWKPAALSAHKNIPLLELLF